MIGHSIARTMGVWIAGVGLALGAVLAGADGAAAQSWSAFLGNWQGNGQLQHADGSQERVQCRVSYQVIGAATDISQSIRCASTSDQIQVSVSMKDVGGRVTGSWRDQRKGTSGNLSGSLNGGQLSLSLIGGGRSASVRVSTSGCRQTIQLQSPTSQIRTMSLTLSKPC